MKKGTLFIIGILLLSLQFSVGTTSAIDGLPPQLHWVTVNTTGATLGDTVVFTLNITDAHGINDMSGDIYYTDTNGYRYYLDTLYYYPGGIDGLLNISYTIQNIEGISKISLDNVYIYNTDGFASLYYNDKYYTNGPYFSVSDVVINPLPEDNIAPVVHSVNLNTTYSFQGQDIRVNISASDEGNGISYMYLYLYQDLSQFGIGEVNYRSIYYVDAYKNESTGFYTAEIRVSEYWRSTDYVVGELYVSDYSNNGQYYNIYDHGNLLSSARFTLDNTGLPRPTVNAVDFVYDNVTTFSEQVIHLNVSSNGVPFQSGSLQLNEYNAEWNEYYFVGEFYFSQSNYNSTSGLFEIPITDDYFGWASPNRDIIAFELSLEIWDENGEYSNIRFFNRIDYQSDSFQLLDMDVIDKIFFEIKASPSLGTVGEETIFSIEVLNTFRQDLFAVDLSITISGPNMDDHNLEVVDLLQNEPITKQIAVTFTTDGIYDVDVSVVGPNGDLWQDKFSYQVRGNGNPTDDTSSDQPTNGSVTPELQLPGFELAFTMISLGAILVTTYRRRRNL